MLFDLWEEHIGGFEEDLEDVEEEPDQDPEEMIYDDEDWDAEADIFSDASSD